MIDLHVSNKNIVFPETGPRVHQLITPAALLLSSFFELSPPSARAAVHSSGNRHSHTHGASTLFKVSYLHSITLRWPSNPRTVIPVNSCSIIFIPCAIDRTLIRLFARTSASFTHAFSHDFAKYNNESGHRL